MSSFGEYRLHPQLIKHEYRLLCNATTFEQLLDQDSNNNNIDDGSHLQEIAQRMLCIKILGASMVRIEPGSTTEDPSLSTLGNSSSKSTNTCTAMAAKDTAQLLKKAELYLLKKQSNQGDWNPAAATTTTTSNNEVAVHMHDEDDEDFYERFATTRWCIFALCDLRFRGWGPAPSGCDHAFQHWKTMERQRQHLGQQTLGTPPKALATATSTTSASAVSTTPPASSAAAATALAVPSNASWTQEDSMRSNPFGMKLYPKEYYQHIALHYDHAKQQELLFSSLPLQRKCQLRMSAMLEWKKNHPYFQEEEEEEEDDPATTTTTNSRKSNHSQKNRGGGSSRRRSEMINHNPRVAVLRKLCKNAKSEQHFIQRLLTSIKKWTHGDLNKRNQLIDNVNDDGCVDISGISVSLFSLFKKVAPLGGLQIKLTSYDWLKVARMLQLPDNILERGNRIKQLYKTYYQKWENDKIDVVRANITNKGKQRRKKRRKREEVIFDVNSRVKVYWDAEQEWYSGFCKAKVVGKPNYWTIEYDDGDQMDSHISDLVDDEEQKKREEKKKKKRKREA